MSTMIATFDLPTERARLALPGSAGDARAELRPWGFWGSLGWGLFAMATGLFAVVIYTGVWMLTHQLRIPVASDAAFGIVAGIAGSVAPVIVLIIAVKSRQYSLRDYFALGGIPRSHLVLGIACLFALVAVFDAMERLFGVDAGSKSVVETYQAAKLAGMLPMLWLAVVIVAPVTEELLFRGFLQRGWAGSWLGVAGTIVLTSALWAVLHQQYNWLGIFAIFLMGLLFGWLRRRSGSTTLTITLHALNNLLAMTCVAIQVEWLT
jgi:membrane protease YdiL (CAAX protease family)